VLRHVVIVLREATNITEIIHPVVARIEEEQPQTLLVLQLIEVPVAEPEVLAPIAEALDLRQQVVALIAQEAAVIVLQVEAQVLADTVVLAAARGVLEVTVAQAVEVLQDHLVDLQVEEDLQAEEDNKFANIKNV